MPHQVAFLLVALRCMCGHALRPGNDNSEHNMNIAIPSSDLPARSEASRGVISNRGDDKESAADLTLSAGFEQVAQDDVLSTEPADASVKKIGVTMKYLKRAAVFTKVSHYSWADSQMIREGDILVEMLVDSIPHKIFDDEGILLADEVRKTFRLRPLTLRYMRPIGLRSNTIWNEERWTSQSACDAIPAQCAQLLIPDACSSGKCAETVPMLQDLFERQASRALLLGNGLPAVCKAGLCKDAVPILRASVDQKRIPKAHRTFQSIAQRTKTDYEIELSAAFKEAFPAACDAGFCKDLLSSAVLLVRALRERRESFDYQHAIEAFARYTFPAACKAGLCEEVMPFLQDLETATAAGRIGAARAALPAACEAGACKEVIPTLNELASDTDDLVREKLASRVVPVACAKGFCKDVVPVINLLGRDRSTSVKLVVASTAIPAACAEHLFNEVKQVLTDLKNDTDRSILSDAKVSYELCESVDIAMEGRKAAEMQRKKAEDNGREADQEREKAMEYLKEVEVQSIRAEISHQEAYRMQEAAEEMAKQARDAELKAEIEHTMLENAKERAENLKNAAIGLGISLAAALLPYFGSMVNTWRKGGGKDEEQGEEAQQASEQAAANEGSG